MKISGKYLLATYDWCILKDQEKEKKERINF